ncbi:MAG: hypothetical protein LKE30_00785 [Bacteroidales bacterium]|jgi:hypothetical protein|nr:hypothetical protein [Bacteroidales bacterium]
MNKEEVKYYERIKKFIGQYIKKSDDGEYYYTLDDFIEISIKLNLVDKYDSYLFRSFMYYEFETQKYYPIVNGEYRIPAFCDRAGYDEMLYNFEFFEKKFKNNRNDFINTIYDNEKIEEYRNNNSKFFYSKKKLEQDDQGEQQEQKETIQEPPIDMFVDKEEEKKKKKDKKDKKHLNSVDFKNIEDCKDIFEFVSNHSLSDIDKIKDTLFFFITGKDKPKKLSPIVWKNNENKYLAKLVYEKILNEKDRDDKKIEKWKITTKYFCHENGDFFTEAQLRDGLQQYKRNK